jgi:predicted DNA-binding WGR domain protein
MRLVRQDRLHFKEGNSDKVYEVDLCEINGLFIVNFRYGRHGTDLKEGSKTTVPVALEEAEKIFQKLVDEKTRKGYHSVGKSAETAEKPKVAVILNDDANARNNAILAKLQNAKAKSDPKIERAIWRAGELKIKEAAPFIAPLIGTAKELRDYCCAWALGICGDENFLDEAQKLAAHKSEAVRRIAFEAMLKLSKNPQNLIEQKISELPENFRQIVRSGNSESLLSALRETIAAHKRGSLDILEQIYVVADENLRSALREVLREIPLKSKFFKPFRHIYKIAEYRCDAEFFGVIARRFEVEKAGFHSNPWWDSIYLQNEDGKWENVKRTTELSSENSRLAFSNKTKGYFLRRTWRFLRKLGEIGGTDYVKMAVGALLAYSDADAQPPRTSTRYDYHDENGNWNWQNPKTFTTVYDEYAPYLLFNHIIRGESERFELKRSAKAFNLKEGVENTNTDQREESFPKLWEAQPVGLLHLLSESHCQPVHEFAVKALRDCREFVSQLDLEAILMLLQSRYEITAEFGFTLAKPFYNSANPNVELILIVATCRNEKARNEAFNWINAHRELFAKNDEAMLKLLTADFADTRKYAANLLQSSVYSETEAQTLIGKILAQMLGFDENDGEKAADLGETLFKTFGRNLRSLNLSVVQDLLSHKLTAVQELGGNILLNHETPAENLPSELINSLIDSPAEPIRSIGIKLFGQLSDENLVKRDDVFFSFLTHELEDVYFSSRAIIRRLATQNADFADVMTRRLIIGLTQKEERENLHSRFLTVLREDLPDWTNFVDEDLARILASSRFPQTAEAGGIVLQKFADKWFEDFTTEEITAFSNNEVLAIRQAAWAFGESAKNRYSAAKNPEFEAEIGRLVKALDSKWQDSREFWFGFFDRNLTEKELLPEIIVSICDSVREDVQKFGRDCVLKYFQAEDGVEYMLKLSEHPSPNMSLFVTNYLETYAADSVENFAKLAPYFVRTLCLVNRGRIAKTRVLNFLESEGLKSAETGKIAAEILARQSATVAIGDKARAVETMLKIHRAFPELALPIKVKETVTKGFNRV